jgi:hypothetical protein
VENVDKSLLINVSHGTTSMKDVYTPVDESVDNYGSCELKILITQPKSLNYTDLGVLCTVIHRVVPSVDIYKEFINC